MDYSPNIYPGVCRKDIPYPSVSHESVPSLIDNLVSALYGSITKSVVNGRVVWNIPCDPEAVATIFGVPRIQGEGLMCYILRVFGGSFTLTGNFQGTFSGNLIGGTAGSIVYQSGVNTTAFLTPGANGTVLTSTGSGLVWTTGVTVSTAANLSGGTTGQIPYQILPNKTLFVGGPGTIGVLHSNGASAPTFSAVTPGDLSNGRPSWDTSGNLTVSGAINAASASITGSVSAASATVTGAVSAGSITGNAATQIIAAALIFG